MLKYLEEFMEIPLRFKSFLNLEASCKRRIGRMEKKIIRTLVHNGIEIIEYSMKNEHLEVCFLNVGGAITKIALAADDYDKNLVVNYENVENYLNNDCYLNALVGRTSNRITDGKFTLNGKEIQVDLNDGPNSLHGGAENLTKSIFAVTTSECGYHLQTVLPDQPDGFPGNVNVSVYYKLEDNQVQIIYKALADKDTIFNPTQHAYFNLSGDLERTIYDHELQINGYTVADINEFSSFTKELIPVEGTRFDFLSPTVIEPAEKPSSALFDRTSGYDHLFVLNGGGHAATLSDPKSGRKLEIYTTEPAMQFYAGNYLNDELLFEGNRAGEMHLGACFETHKIPFDFESQKLEVGDVYTQEAIWVFSKEG